MDVADKRRFDAVKPLVGGTPLLEIAVRFRGRERKIYAKVKYYKPTGSIKDRVAYHIKKGI